MTGGSDAIAAHLILGSRAEPFLAATLESIAPCVAYLLVNDNSPDPSPHDATLRASAFARENRMTVDRTPFDGFAGARNVCLRLHERCSGAGWVAFVDADEVHAAAVATIARNLGAVAPGVAFVDGYTWHFFQSFDYYTSIERRMAFFRFTPGLRWEGAVHERLTGAAGTRLALPYVYAHYGHTLEPRRHAEKGRHYSALGAPGDVLSEDRLGDFDVAQYFAPEYPRLLRFDGAHPPAARSTLERLRPLLAQSHALTDRMVQAQPPAIVARNAVRKLNYELRWRGRAFDPRARRVMRD
ncbi:MAG TPA: glycosyltransferase [Candidatus Tumulicola sp.]|nr:glycosyltransferase [Candidatus Tumulicola sp.]